MMITPARINGKHRFNEEASLEKLAKHIPPWKRTAIIREQPKKAVPEYPWEQSCMKCRKGPVRDRQPTLPRRRRGRPFSPQSIERAMANRQCTACGHRMIIR